MSRVIQMEPRPEAYAPKEIVAVESDAPGWLVQFECDHIVWCAVKPEVGDKRVCAVCLDRLLRELRKSQAWGVTASLQARKIIDGGK